MMTVRLNDARENIKHANAMPATPIVACETNGKDANPIMNATTPMNTAMGRYLLLRIVSRSFQPGQ
jgi:hypothetical protein